MTVANTGTDSFLTGALPYLSGAGTYLKAFGQFEQGQGYLEHGMVQNEAAQFAAAQLRQNANAVAGATQRSAQDIQLQSKYILSTQMARAAASGGGASDPTVVNLMARTAALGAYRANTAIYQGQSAAQRMNLQASGELWSGQEEQRVSQRAAVGADVSALSTLTSGAVSLYEKYGRSGPGAG